MQRNMWFICCTLWLFLVCFTSVCPSARKHQKCRYDRHRQILQKLHSVRRFCDPSNSLAADALPQKCSSGFYREWKGQRKGQCVPCRCNGLSAECDEHTGNCVNCQFNTAGDHCERCKEGCYGNAANRTCHACPCPFTWNNLALTCLDIGSGVVECLCRRGYEGPRCERCSFGYYGNPMVPGGSCKPCNCKDLNSCDSLTGDCIMPRNSNSGSRCNECDSCSEALLLKLEDRDDALAAENLISQLPGPVSQLTTLEADIFQTMILVLTNRPAVRHPKAEELEVDVSVVKADLSQLTEEKLETLSSLEKVSQDVIAAEAEAEDLLLRAEALLTGVPAWLRLPEVKAEDSFHPAEENKAVMMEELRNMVKQMKVRSCAANRAQAGSEQQETHKTLELINRTVYAESSQAALRPIADALTASDSFLRELTDLLSDTEVTAGRTHGLNLRSATGLQHLQNLLTFLELEQSVLHSETETTKDMIKSITNIFLGLKDMRQDFDHHVAQLDGARQMFFRRLNANIHMAKVDVVTKAEEHAEEAFESVNRLSAHVHQFHNATSSTDPATGLSKVQYYNSLINTMGTAERAANQSNVAAAQDFKGGRLVTRAEEVKDYSTRLWTEVSSIQMDLSVLSHSANVGKDTVNEQKEKSESLQKHIETIRANLQNATRDDTKVLIESTTTAASSSNIMAHNITERMKNVSQQLEKITFPNVTIEDMLADADRALKSLDAVFPVLRNNLAETKMLSKTLPPSANISGNIKRIKDVIEETRTLVKGLTLATTFNGKGHIELHPPRNLEELKASTAVDLLLNIHPQPPPKAALRPNRRQDKHRRANLFVFYLGNRNASGDYVGMAIRQNHLVCVYKLGVEVHEVRTSLKLTPTSVNSSTFDRVVFHRFYQDIEFNITKNFTSQKPVTYNPSHFLPVTMNGVLQLDPDSVVFYVGGYPDDFKPPETLRYAYFRGAMKLSYINDNPVSLFNYKRAVNMDAKQSTASIPQLEVSDYYDGTGYRLAFLKEPQKQKRRLFKFHTKSREADALLFYIGNEESFVCVFVEQGFLVLRGQQAGRALRVQTSDKVSLFENYFGIVVADRFTVHYGRKQISTSHIPTNYTSYYMGGLPTELRRRHNITAPPLRGCVDHLTADAQLVEYNTTVGVSDGCPVSLLGVRTATLYSALSADSLLVWDQTVEQRVSLGFTSTESHGAILSSSPQMPPSDHTFSLSLNDGYVVFRSRDQTLVSHERYSDGRWHYVSAVSRPTRLELSIDNVNVIEGQSPRIRPEGGNLKDRKFRVCVANVYSRHSPQRTFMIVDLSPFSKSRDIYVGQCSLHPPPPTEDLPAPVMKRPHNHKTTQDAAGVRPTPRSDSWCGGHRGGVQLSDAHSWLSFILPQQDLNYRPHFSLNIKTKSSKGLIFHVAGRGAIPLLALYMANGKIKMSLGHNRIIHHKEKSNDGQWHKVEFSVERNTFHLLVDGIRVTDGHLPNSEGSLLDLHSHVYLGGDLLSTTTKGHQIPMDSIIGCVRDFHLSSVAVGKPHTRHRALPCFDELVEMGTFFAGGHIILDNYLTVGPHFVLAFEMRPQHLTGLLLHASSDKTSLNVFLMESKVRAVVSHRSSAVSVSVSPHDLCDGRFHSVTVSIQPEVITLTVDDVSEQRASPTVPASKKLHTLYVGGMTRTNRVPLFSPFIGCLRNVNVNGRRVALDAESTVVGQVNINRCPSN